MKLRQTPSRDEQQAFLDYGDRVVDGDTTPPTTDLESTFLRVQRAMRADHRVPGTMPDRLRMRAWEDIMQNTATLPSGRAAAGSGKRARPAAPVSLPRMAWTGAANIALAILVVIAGFGAWRAFDGGIGGGSNGPAPSGGHYAQAPTTPAPMASAETEAAFSTCDFSTSVPIYSGVDSPAVGRTVLYITSSGDFTLACPEEREPIVLSRNAASVWETHAPGVVRIQLPNGSTTDEVLMNVVTNEWIQLNPSTSSSYLGDANMGRTLLVSTVVDAPDAWSVLNLETMTWATLPDLTGAKLPASAHIMVATASDQQGVAVALSEYRTEGSATLMPAYGAQGDIAVIEDDLETVHWVSVPQDFPEVTNISLSPDASRLALISNLTSYNEPTAQTTISVMDVASGEEIVRSEPFIASLSAFFQWAENGNAVVYTTDSAVYRLELAAGATATNLYSTNGTLMLMPATTQPNLVHLHERIDDATSNLVILTTDSGDVVTVAGEPWFAGTTPVMSWTEQLAPVVVMPNDGTSDTVIVHPVTGEPITGPVNAPPPATPAEGQEVWYPPRLVETAPDAPVSVVNLGTGALMIVNLSQSEAVVTELPLPVDFENDGYKLRNVSLAPDGTTIIVETTLGQDASRFWTLDLGNGDAEWNHVPNGVSVSYLYPSD